MAQLLLTPVKLVLVTVNVLSVLDLAKESAMHVMLVML